MAEASSLQPTSTVVQRVASSESSPAVKLKLQKPRTDKKVKWEEGTVDNEHMNKKKSKCCCIYEKPKLFGEVSSDSDNSDSDGDDCTGNCRGHKKKCFRQMPPDQAQPDHDEAGASGASPS